MENALNKAVGLVTTPLVYGRRSRVLGCDRLKSTVGGTQCPDRKWIMTYELISCSTRWLLPAASGLTVILSLSRLNSVGWFVMPEDC
jgi:hypothetical protein